MGIMHFDFQLRKEEAKEKEMKMHLSAAINSSLEKQMKKTNWQAGDRWGKKKKKKDKKIHNKSQSMKTV